MLLAIRRNNLYMERSAIFLQAYSFHHQERMLLYRLRDFVQHPTIGWGALTNCRCRRESRGPHFEWQATAKGFLLPSHKFAEPLDQASTEGCPVTLLNARPALPASEPHSS